MKRITRWSPDTCKCILEYSWDDTQDETNRVHTFKRIISLCPEHQGLGFGDKSAYDKVVSENQSKNYTWATLREELNLTEQDISKYVWFFNKDRQLQVSLTQPPIATDKKTVIQGKLDNFLGKDKVNLI